MQRVVLDIGKNADGHLKGGQFVQMKVADSKPGFYAIASPPDPNNRGVIELLIKNQGNPAEQLCSQTKGAKQRVAFASPCDLLKWLWQIFGSTEKL